jgi:transitional endoplasmic reticulum ATPase
MTNSRSRLAQRAGAWIAAGLLVFAFLALVAGGRAAASSARAVSHDVAIRLAQEALVVQADYEREFVDGLEATATRRADNGRDYWIVDFAGAGGQMRDRVVLTANGVAVTDRPILQRLGGWDSYLSRAGAVGSWGWAIVGLVSSAAVAFAAFVWTRRPRMGGWKAWFVNSALVTFVLGYAGALMVSLSIDDLRGSLVCGVSAVAIAGGAVLGVVRRGRYGQVGSPAQAPVGLPERSASPSEAPLGREESQATSSAARAVPAGPGGKVGVGAQGPSDLRVIPPEALPSFSDVGGMDGVKKQFRETVGVLVSHSDLVRRYKVDWNGVLLYGPPGVGKTFMAKAAAGEFGLSFIDVRVSDVISSFVGQSSKLVAEVFAEAVKRRPCVLFFDEFDSIGQRREDTKGDSESVRVVNQLLRELESVREVPDLIVMAATNHKSTLDEAVIRPGRFDRHIAIPMPDEAARLRVLEAQLSGRPVTNGIDLGDLVIRTEGMSAADITSIVNGAALEAMRRSIAKGTVEPGVEEPITPDALQSALEELRAKVRPVVTFTSWEDLVLADGTRKKLQDLQTQIENSEELAVRGVEVPRGILLYGPPGTGKTTVARVLASQANASFFSVDASEITSMWLGETEKRIHRLFEDARRHRPSIVFIDEIDSLVATRERGDSTSGDITSQFLREIDGVMGSPGVFVIGATNVPDALDPALLRGGRLSRQMLIPAPDRAGREALFAVHSRRMDLADDVDFGTLAVDAEGHTGADIKEICHAAGLLAFERDAVQVTMADFVAAHAAYSRDRRAFKVPEWMGASWDAPAKKSLPLGFVQPTRANPGDETGSAKPGPPGKD